MTEKVTWVTESLETRFKKLYEEELVEESYFGPGEKHESFKAYVITELKKKIFTDKANDKKIKASLDEADKIIKEL